MLKSLSIIALFSFLVIPVNMQIQICKRSNDFVNDHKDHILNFDPNQFYKQLLPTKAQMPDKYLGAGAFGEVYSYDLLARDTQNIVPSALKVIRFPNKLLGCVNTELSVHQHLAKFYVLEMPRYFGCSFSKSIQQVMIFGEKMDAPLDSLKFRTEYFKKYDFPTKIGLLLLMLRGIKVLADHQLVHMDIKTENFMIIDGATPVVKMIDFGMVTPVNAVLFGGSRLFMDPEIYKQSRSAYPMDYYRTNTKSDIYSLGLTFQEILYSRNDIVFEKYCIRDYKSMKQCSISRERKIKTKQDSTEIRLKTHEYIKQIKILNMIIRDMIKTDPDERKDLNDILYRLTKVVREMKADSIYLPENRDALIATLYGELNETNTPLLEDAGSNEKELRRKEAEEALRQKKLLEEQERANQYRQSILPSVNPNVNKPNLKESAVFGRKDIVKAQKQRLPEIKNKNVNEPIEQQNQFNQKEKLLSYQISKSNQCSM